MNQTTTRTVVAWIAQILSALIVLAAATGKLLGRPGWIERFRNWGYPDGFYFVIGVLELLGAITLLFPRMAGRPAAGLLVIMLGALLTHLFHGEGLAVLRPLIVIVLLVAVLWLRGFGSR
jgi:hypothetical protein